MDDMSSKQNLTSSNLIALPSVLNTDNKSQHLKKLYFKPSTTEALHSAILLKARSNQSSTQSTTCLNNLNKINKILPPKISNVSTLLSISTNSHLSNQHLENNSNDSDISLNNNFYSDELDSPFKIKENIFSSIKNLKPCLIGLDPMRLSVSDDEESHSENFDRKTQIGKNEAEFSSNSTDIIVLETTNQMNANSSNYNSNVNIKNMNLKGSLILNKNISTYKASTIIPTTQPTSILLNKVINTSNNLIPQLNLNRSGSKRAKEEALSNSSSSDEEDANNRKPQSTITNTKSQSQVTISTIMANRSQVSAIKTSNNLLSTSSLSNNAPPFITPVVNSNVISNTNNNFLSLPASLINSPINSSSNESELINSPSSISTSSSYSFNSSTSPCNSATSSASVKSQKSSIDQDYDSKFSNSMLSIASPTSCCSSLNTYDANIDFNDDNSSTSSGPVYIRQPGFEHHAHEIVIQQQNKAQTSTTTIGKQDNLNNDLNNRLTTLKNFVINTENKTNRISKLSKKPETNLLKQQGNSLSASSLPTNIANSSKSNKAKKKLCMMNKDLSTQNFIDSSNDKNNFHLKPISNKLKKNPLPMRLRALPPSFWQQPNQPNVSPGTMYLPPLFKNEIENVSEDNNIDDEKFNSLEATPVQREREVKISLANTDLLFKLFDNIDQNKDRKQIQLLFETQYKANKNNQKSLKAISKALIKGEDPCIVDAVSESLFPQLKLDTRNEVVHSINVKQELSINNLASHGLSSSPPALPSNSTLNLMNNNTNSVSSALPLLQIEQNFSQALSEVVAAL